MAAAASASNDATTKREKDIEKLKMEIRSILITCKNGSTVQELQQDFDDLNGRPIPTRELGFRDIKDLILSMPDVVNVRTTADGKPRLYAQSHESTRRIESLINRTKCSRVTRFGGTEQHQPTPEQQRLASERKRIIKERMIEIASRTTGFIAYNDLRRKYQATYGEMFDPKADFKCQPKVLFSMKWGRNFVVVGGGRGGGPLNFQVRLRETARTEFQDYSSGAEASAPGSRSDASRFSNSQPFGSSRAAGYGGDQNRRLTESSTFGGNRSSGNPVRRQSGFGGVTRPQQALYNPPRFANQTPFGGTAGNSFQGMAPTRFGGSSFENMARPSAPAATANRSTTYPTSVPVSDSNTAYAPLTVTVSSNAGRSERSILLSSPSSAAGSSFRRQPQPEVSTRTSTATLKNRISELLSKYPNGIELHMFKDAYFYHFKQECGVGNDFLRQSCSDICDLIWSEGALRYYIKPKTSNSNSNPLSSMAEIGAALPTVTPRAPPPYHSQPAPTPIAAPAPTPIAAPTPMPIAAPTPVASSSAPLPWDELKKQLHQIMRKYPSGIAYLAFPKAYRAATGRELDLAPYGLLSVTELVKQLPEVFLCVKCNGELMLYDAKMGDDRPMLGSSNAEVVNDMGRLADEIWVLAMNAARHSLSLSRIPEMYQATFEKPFPVQEFEGDVSMKLFDYLERFEFSYEGCVCVIARPEYEPSHDVARFLVKKQEDGISAEELVSGHVLPAERYVTQSLPDNLHLLVSLDDSNENRFFQVHVAQVESPGRFFVQLQSTYDKLEELIGEMSRGYSGITNAAAIPTDELSVGMACACRYEDDGCWYRGAIKNVNGNEVLIMLVDYGTELALRSGSVFYLAREFFTLPAQAIECSLAYLAPVDGTWPMESGEIMAQFCGSAILTAEYCKIEEGVLQVYLMKNCEDGTDIHLNDILLEANLAILQNAQGTSGNAGVEEDTNDFEDEAESGADNSSAHSFRTALDEDSNLLDATAQFSTPTVLDRETEALVDMTFEEDVINQMKEGDLMKEADLEVVNLAKTILCRKRVALTKKLGNGGSSEANDLIVDKLSWLEQQIHWLAEHLKCMDSV